MQEKMIIIMLALEWKKSSAENPYVPKC